ncbi:MAG: PaaI family thioesterase [Frankiales bacterium]|nr:PaaI family thioesterase [Frankiales bacterium]
MTSDAGTSYAYDGFDKTIGLHITSARADEVVATIEVTPALLQPYGLLHGGVLCSVVETLGSVGGAVWFGDRGNVVGVHNSTHFLRAVREGTLTAVARPVHQGGSQQLWRIEVRDDHEQLVATGDLRVANLRKRD